MDDNLFKECRTAEEVVFQAVGAGSVCWENMSGTGVFDDARAKRAGDDAVRRLAQLR